MRRSAIISFALHLALVLAAIIALPPMKLNSSADDSVSLDLVGPAAPQQATAPGKVAAQSNTKTIKQAALTKTPPKPRPNVAPPPPPPPPPPPSKAVQPAVAQPLPKPPPPQPTKPAIKTPPPPPQPRVIHKPPPPQPVKSPLHQKHKVHKPVPLSSSVLNTLMNLKALQKQTKPPTSTYNPQQGGAPNGGGSTQSTSNSGLTGADRDAIGAHVRPCWNIDAGAPGVQNFNIELLVTTDATGTVREAVVAPQDQAKLSDPLQAAYANDAINAVMNYQCATLPLPSYMLGKNQTFLFDFTP